MRTLVNLPSPCAGTSNGCAAVDQTTLETGPEGLPGVPGANGAAGASGRNAFTTTAGPFVMPVVGAQASVQVQDNRSFAVGQLVYLASVGYFEVTTLTGVSAMGLRNLGGTSALPAGALIGSGLKLTSGGRPGPDTAANTPKRYAIIASIADRGEDGGPMMIQLGTGSTAQGIGRVENFEAISDPDSIAAISGDADERFRLPVGLWKVRVRVPCYYCKAFQVYLVEKDGSSNLYIIEDGSGGIAVKGPRLASGNGYAGLDGDGADPQRHATADALVSVTDPEKWLEVVIRQEFWTFNRTLSLRNKAKGIGSDFDNGAGVDVREIFTTVEIEEL